MKGSGKTFLNAEKKNINDIENAVFAAIKKKELQLDARETFGMGYSLHISRVTVQFKLGSHKRMNMTLKKVEVGC